MKSYALRDTVPVVLVTSPMLHLAYPSFSSAASENSFSWSSRLPCRNVFMIVFRFFGLSSELSLKHHNPREHAK